VKNHILINHSSLPGATGLGLIERLNSVFGLHLVRREDQSLHRVIGMPMEPIGIVTEECGHEQV
jgi:hypothetical protein